MSGANSVTVLAHKATSPLVAFAPVEDSRDVSFWHGSEFEIADQHVSGLTEARTFIAQTMTPI